MGSIRRRVERLEERAYEPASGSWIADERRARVRAEIEALWEGLSEAEREARLPHLREIEGRVQRRLA
jgi:hypothetical protein